MVEPLRHRQTKGAETDMPSLPPPRHIPTLPTSDLGVRRRWPLPDQWVYASRKLCSELTPKTAAGRQRPLLRRRQGGRGCLHHRRRVPFTGQRIALRGIKTHGEVGRPFRCRQPIRFFVSAGAFFLEIEVEGPVRVVFERHSAADGEPVEAVGALGTPQRRDLLG